MTPSIETIRELSGRVGRGECRELSRRLSRAARPIGVGREALRTVGVRIVDDRRMRQLHARFMGDDTTTDVLSFPASEGPGELETVEMLGDIVLNWDAVRRQTAPGTSLMDEATVLCVHGLAHLLGHDHQTRADGRAMHRLERRALRGARVPDVSRPYGLG